MCAAWRTAVLSATSFAPRVAAPRDGLAGGLGGGVDDPQHRKAFARVAGAEPALCISLSSVSQWTSATWI